MFIVIEGIDASGKTTVSKFLSKKINAIWYSTPPGKFKKKREGVDRVASPENHYRFYLAGINRASYEINNMLLFGNMVVCDRYWLSTYVYHKVMGVNVKLSDFSNIIKPDLTILLEVGKNEQVRRFRERGLSIGDRRMINKQDALNLEYLKSLSLKQNGQNFIVHTDNVSPEKIVEKICIEFDLR